MLISKKQESTLGYWVSVLTELSHNGKWYYDLHTYSNSKLRNVLHRFESVCKILFVSFFFSPFFPIESCIEKFHTEAPLSAIANYHSGTEMKRFVTCQ